MATEILPHEVGRESLAKETFGWTVVWGRVKGSDAMGQCSLNDLCGWK